MSLTRQQSLLALAALTVPFLNTPAVAKAPQDRIRQAEHAAKATRLSVNTVKELNAALGIDFRNLEKMSSKQLRQAVGRLDEGEEIAKRLEFQRAILTGSKDKELSNEFASAYAEQKGTRDLLQSKVVAGIPTGKLGVPPPLDKGLDQKGWVSLGPNVVSGRTRCIVIDKDNPETIWIGSVSGGLWKSADRGQSFDPVDDFMANLSISSLAQSPKDPQFLVAGTGEGFGNGDGMRGSGVFYTRDGSNWSPIAMTQTDEFSFISGVTFDRTGNSLFVAVNNSLSSGIYRCRADNIEDLEQVFEGDVSGIRTNPKDARYAIAGSLRSGKSYYTVDGGATWSESDHSFAWSGAGRGSGRVEVTYSVANPDIVYASVDVSVNAQGSVDTDNDNNQFHGVVFKSTDGGKTFLKCRTARPGDVSCGYLGGQGYYDNAVWAGDPRNPNLVIVGGIELWRSLDGGESFRQISRYDLDASAHSDHHTIVSDPGYDGLLNKRVYFGNDGGLAMAEDVTTVGSDASLTKGWVRLDRGLVTTQFYHAAVSPGLGLLVGGLQDNGTWLATKSGDSMTWKKIFGGDGGVCQIDSAGKMLYGEYVFGSVQRYSLTQPIDYDYIGGMFWDSNEGHWTWKEEPNVISDSPAQQGNFIAPFMLDPNRPNRLLVGMSSLWCTDDVKTPNDPSRSKSGPLWKAIKPPYLPDNWWGYISSVLIQRGESDEIWVGHNDGTIFKTTNGTDAQPDWKVASIAGQMPNRMCLQLVSDPRDRNTVYALFAGFYEDNLWVTRDGGGSWEPLTNGLGKAPFRSFAIHPDNSRLLYLGTEIGVYASDDGGESWAPTNQGPANCAVTTLTFWGKKLFAVTYGRGVFSIDLSNP